MVHATAAVVVAHGAPFTFDSIEVPEPRADEVRVRIHAVGICHTDLAVAGGHRDVPVPVVLGHEGAGVVESVGSAVTRVAVGQRVALSFASCGRCSACETGRPALCASLLALNFGGRRADGSTTLRAGDGSVLHGSFFGQSSFATLALVAERSVVPIPDDMPFELAAPLGCGIQTGAGAVWRSLDVSPGDTVIVSGAGAVGLAAVIAARIRGAANIVAVDGMPSRLQAALAVGATHVVNGATEDLREVIRVIAPDGADAAVDTTAAPPVIERTLEALRRGGTLALVASGRGADAVRLGLLVGKRVIGVLEGDSVPSQAIPQLAALYRSGAFPLEALVRTYPFADIDRAVAEMKSGEAIKPVLLMPCSC
ncbi:NAD(P)-dependent alcohol dehydrogenase [Rathayibacter sp. VKM Ac-2760]|uniref:NAD(P)-dependent alcohol dehydrogenase n=1 Tax=Rathayibacter sp. VKM Ac-2760 TaxID=2609253 RepID=UPI0013199CC6|nr:NAD(P)-dependent alcohol dehydrogenase [Rathayibacter sp. VKM Ac-2760]QHC58688.1 alcohol dehydrogenase catalytic domain-containing protein [Rathayibacter sp. VKM Ac-2760]